MFIRWTLRYKLGACLALLFVAMGILVFYNDQAVTSFRDIARSIRVRSGELPHVADLSQRISDLRVTLSRVESASFRCRIEGATTSQPAETRHRPISLMLPQDESRDVVPYADRQFLRAEFQGNLFALRQAVDKYDDLLRDVIVELPSEEASPEGRNAVEVMRLSLDRIEKLDSEQDWILNELQVQQIDDEIQKLQQQNGKLPAFLQARLERFSDDVRLQYRTMWTFNAVTIGIAGVALALVAWFIYASIFKPLRELVRGSRLIQGGNFEHRVRLRTNDEVAELAEAFNAVTDKLVRINKNLENEVKQRTREVVRQEKMASVGFLAAGVAHEINNPLAGIAMCAELLQGRMNDLAPEEEATDPFRQQTRTDFDKYLTRIQEEAFRCKGITERLLDYSRMGAPRHDEANLADLIRNVAEMISEVGKYRRKRVKIGRMDDVVSSVNSQEIKQVVLNLLTNALDSVEEDRGTVTVDLLQTEGGADIVVVDDGCGMTDEVKEHLFEPFFTRRRDQQGTGLGLSIVHQIVTDHGGKISATSDGPGKGSRFTVWLPDIRNEEKRNVRKAA
ncbi:MAG TPA: HAMP domain-containing sensor histidine kinase [Pirellulaceae bacterium]|nr:HAMP domain-containing sensor histidine kinase [Pirellulaceae bacterium]